MSSPQQSERYVLAIDMGSGSAKAALVSNSGQVVASGISSIGTIHVEDGGVEQDPEECWSAVRAAAKSALQAAEMPREKILAVACTTQWSVTIPVDENGRALMNAISWMDTRGGKYNRDLSAGWPQIQGYGLLKALKWVRLTGGAPLPSGADSFGHIQFIKREHADIYSRTYKFLEPMDYLNLRLTGRFAASFATMYTSWITDNRDPLRVDYSPALLRLAGVEREKFPDLFPVDHVLGDINPEIARDFGLPETTRVVMGTCDLQSATLGAGVVDDFDGYFYVGTSGWISCHIPEKKTSPVRMLSSMIAAVPGRYLLTAEQGVAGRCLEYLAEILFGPEGASPGVDIYDEMNRIATQVRPGSDGVIFTPWLGGVFAPAGEPETRGAFFNQTLTTTRGHLIRATMEGVAFNLRWLKDHVEKFLGHRFERLAFIGGGASSDLWCQILADILGCSIRRIENPRSANAVGAAMAAFAALGEIRMSEVPKLLKTARVFEPEKSNRAVYDRQFREFIQLFRRNRAVYRRLNRHSI